jgi:hypothetical protein
MCWDYLSWGGSYLRDDQAVPCCIDDLQSDRMQVVDVETLRIDDRTYQLTADNLSLATQTDTVSPFLKSFRLEIGLPVFTYASDEFTLEKRLCMVHAQNTHTSPITC